tara:strand:+ start:1769 stop:2185 length:417 start_codon:yes stop_codon:yes gene_type:complete
MNTALILIIFIPLIEIYLFIKIGAQIGAFNTISLILISAIVGVYYAKYEGLNTLKSAVSQMVSNKIPIYEILSGAALAIASLLLILPGFATDTIGLLLIIPTTRKFFLKKLSTKYKQSYKSNDPIEGEYKDLDDKDGK